MASATDAPSGLLLIEPKLRPPARRELVPRPELVRQLVGGPGERLAVVSAPAGWGKTTLMAEWAGSELEQRPFAWLSLERRDSEPGRFWTYVVSALQKVEPTLGARALGLLTAPGVDLEREALPVLVNDLAELPEGVVLALDDYHLVESPDTHAQMGFLVEHLPPGCKVGLATRVEPPLPLARLRVRGELTEVRAEQLRFSPEETRTLLGDALQLDVPAEQAAALRQRTEGWAAGLYLAALSLRNQPDAAGFIDAFAGDDRHVVDYLGSEVLAGLPEEVREFVLRTSVLDRFSAPLCDTLTGSDSAGRLLPEIERSNLFLVALDERREWYRYHHLFAELLRLELARLHPGLTPELHRRAAAWHLAAGDADRAIRHTIAAGDHAEAAEMVAEHWTRWLLERGEHNDLDAWLRALPAELVRSDARLCVAKVFAGDSMGRLEGLDVWLAAARDALGPHPDPRVETDVAAAHSSHYVLTGDSGATFDVATPAIEHGDRSSLWYPVPFGARAHARRWSGDLEGALEDFAGYQGESAERGQILSVISTYGSLAMIHAEAGRWSEAEACAGTAVEMTQHALSEHWMMGNTHTALALLNAQRREYEAAHASGARAVELVRRGGVPGDRANTLLTVASLRLAAGARGEAQALVEEARTVLAAAPDPGALVLERLEQAERSVRSTAPEAEAGEELSDRELAVLRLMATELSQREIGQELYVSLNTVKTHSRHIFRKLDVSGRHQAVARARELALL